MAAASGRTDPSIAESLTQQSCEFEFFQAVRLLTFLNSGRRLISRFGDPLDDAIRFHAHLSMDFPASAIQELSPSEAGTPRHMTVNFMGLTGPAGALPAHYTEYLINRGFAKDEAAAAFFDLFNHRLIALLYLAWEKHRFPVAFERETLAAAGAGRFTQYLFDLIGMGTASLRGRLKIDDTALLFYSGLIAQRPHSASALAGILRDYFQVPLEIDQFIGGWSAIEAEALSYLDGNGDYGRLGAGAVAGDTVWNMQARFRVRLGPLSWTQYNCFLPGGSAYPALTRMVAFYAGQTFDFDVQLILAAEEVPECQLSDHSQAARLGLSTWLKTIPFTDDARELVLML